MQLTSQLTCQGHEVDTAPQAFGSLRPSSDLIDQPAELRQRLEADGYLFLPGYLDSDEVLAARLAVCRKLEAAQQLDPDYPILDAIVGRDRPGASEIDVRENNPQLMQLLYKGRMIAFYELLLGAPVRHFDYTWFRLVKPGIATPPHCDVLYMGRGTSRLFTSWTPIGDVSYEDGGLMIMEKSNHIEPLRKHYCRKDVDAVCTNRFDKDGQPRMQEPNFGYLSKNPTRLRKNLGLRWLTNEYRAGDLLVFTLHTIHASLDNHGPRYRLSSDSRYQRADEPADERWISIDGQPPSMHGAGSSRSMIC